MLKKILFRADARYDIGMGDLTSLIHLSRYFEDDGWETYFLMRDYGEGRSLVSKYGVKNKCFMPGHISANDEVSFMNRYCFMNDIRAIFACITQRSLLKYKGLDKRLIRGCVNFDGRVPRDWDLVVNWDVNARRFYKRSECPGTKFLTGPNHAILPYNFDWEKIRSRVYKGRPRNLLIGMGGADEDNFTEKIIKKLNEIGCGLKLYLLLGAGYRFKDSLLRTLKRTRFRYKIFENIDNVFKVYMKADLAIGSGGLTSSELVATRTPALLISLYEHQIARCRFFDGKGAAIYLGHRTAGVRRIRLPENPGKALDLSLKNRIHFEREEIIKFFNQRLRRW
jgi:spore coat polysaccharide biosynthesis predicted glycosyltransferase SpsG